MFSLLCFAEAFLPVMSPPLILAETQSLEPPALLGVLFLLFCSLSTDLGVGEANVFCVVLCLVLKSSVSLECVFSEEARRGKVPFSRVHTINMTYFC